MDVEDTIRLLTRVFEDPLLATRLLAVPQVSLARRNYIGMNYGLRSVIPGSM
jgi:hypothetical protein